MIKRRIYVSVFVMVISCLAFVVGILAASQASVNIGGTVSYETKGNVKATVIMTHTAENAIYVTSGNNLETQEGTTSTITFNGNETTGQASGSFNITGTSNGTNINLLSTGGAEDDIVYSYTLKIVNNYTTTETAEKKSLKVSFIEPQNEDTSFVHVTYKNGYTLTPIDNGNSVVLAPGAMIKIIVTFTCPSQVSASNISIASRLVLEPSDEEGQNCTVGVYVESLSCESGLNNITSITVSVYKDPIFYGGNMIDSYGTLLVSQQINLNSPSGAYYDFNSTPIDLRGNEIDNGDKICIVWHVSPTGYSPFGGDVISGLADTMETQDQTGFNHNIYGIANGDDIHVALNCNFKG